MLVYNMPAPGVGATWIARIRCFDDGIGAPQQPLARFLQCDIKV
jgi:hypothetical protein